MGPRPQDLPPLRMVEQLIHAYREVVGLFGMVLTGKHLVWVLVSCFVGQSTPLTLLMGCPSQSQLLGYGDRVLVSKCFCPGEHGLSLGIMLTCGTFDLPVMSVLFLLALSANGERDWPFGPLFQMQSSSLIIESLDPGREEVDSLC